MKKIGLLDIIYSGVVVTDSLERMINIDEENFFDVDTFLRFFIIEIQYSVQPSRGL